MPIAWTNFPVTPGYTPTAGVNLYLFLLQQWRARQERGWARGSEFWPRPSYQYDADASVSYSKNPGYTGIIGTAAPSGNDYVVTVGGKAWPSNRWAGSPPDPDFPPLYDLVIEIGELDPWKVVRVPIIAQPAADQLKLDGASADDWFTAWAPLLFPPSDAFPGCRCIIEKRDEGGHRSVHWHQRWPEQPNATAYASGIATVFAVDTIEDLSAHMLTVPATGLGKWVGKELLLKVTTPAGDRLKRFTITAHTAKRITVTVPVGWTLLAGEYAVVDANAKWAPGRGYYPKAPAFAWYRGIRGPVSGLTGPDPRYWTHSRDPSIGMEPTPVAAMTVKVQKMDAFGIACVDTDVDAFDEDLWSRPVPADTLDPDYPCDKPDRPYAPDLYKTLRALQADDEAACFEFVNRRINWHGADSPPQNFTPATLLRAMGATAYGKTVTYTVVVNSAVASGNGFVTFSPITLPQIRKPLMTQAEIWAELAGLPVHYAILDRGVKPMDFGYSYAFRTMTDYPKLCGFLMGPTQLNLRDATYEEANASSPPYPLTQPDMDNFVGKTLVIALPWEAWIERQVRYLNPKTALMDGITTSYATRAASTTYCESTARGTTSDTGIAFKPDELVRVVGDRWYDPTTGVPYTGGSPPALAASTDRFFTEARPRMSGAATEGGTWYLRDESRSLDGDTPERSLWGSGSAPARVETFTADAGSTATTIVNSGGSPTYWGGGDGRIVGFVFEVQATDGTWHKRPATAYNAGSKTVTIAPALPFSASSRPVRLREPFVLNDYAGPYRTIVFWVAGVLYMPTVLYNDDDTLYFADIGVTIPSGTQYTTDEPQPGEVLKYVAASGPTPARFYRTTYGPDPRGNNPILTETRANCPTLIRRFRRMQRDDLITDTLLNQLYASVNEMHRVRDDGAWIEGLQKGSGSVLISTPYSQDKLQAEIVNGWNAATAFPIDIFVIQEPFAGAAFDTDITGEANAAWFDGHLAASRTTRIAHKQEAWAYTSTDPDDFGEYRRTNVPLGAPDLNSYFRAHGSGAMYRRWVLLGVKAAGIFPDINVRVGSRGGADDLANCPTDWPPPAAPAYPDNLNRGQWSVASRNGIDPSSPVLLSDFGVEGGFGYRDTGPGALLPLPGAGMSGLAAMVL